MDYIEIGKNIRYFRMQQTLTQRQLAELTNCSAKHLGNIERGLSRPSLECLYDISQALNISMDTLISNNSSFPFLYDHSKLVLVVDQFLKKQQDELLLFQNQLFHYLTEHQHSDDAYNKHKYANHFQ